MEARAKELFSREFGLGHRALLFAMMLERRAEAERAEARSRRERAERERVRVAGEDEWTGDQTRRRR